MKREVDLREISDGKLYRSTDLAKADTGGCSGCSACCRGMEETIVLDPYDMYRFQKDAGLSFSDLLNGHAKLIAADGLIFPVLAMDGEEESCTFLDENGRCSVHNARPGICRMFPLGRYYEGGSFRYFLQVHECSMPRTKIRIRKWLDTPDLAAYEQYICTWHYFTETADRLLGEPDGMLRRSVCLYLLQVFYEKPWKTEESFYPQFEKRLAAARAKLSISPA